MARQGNPCLRGQPDRGEARQRSKPRLTQVQDRLALAPDLGGIGYVGADFRVEQGEARRCKIAREVIETD